MPELILLRNSQEIIRFPLTNKGLSLGRSSSNNIVLSDETISRFHARVNFTEENYWIKNFGASGIKVNDRVVADVKLSDGDVIQIGSYVLKYKKSGADDELRDSSVLTVIKPIADDSTQILSSRESDSIEIEQLMLETKNGLVELTNLESGFSVGNTANNSLVIQDPYVSGNHLKIFRKNNSLYFKDLGSTNGTYLNGKNRDESILNLGDEIKLGESVLKLISRKSQEKLKPLNEAYFCGMIGGQSLQVLFSKIKKVAPTDLTVLIEAESGCGKELVARSVHDLSQVSTGPYVVVNCGAISGELIESELFGHEKGAFTGALARRLGAFEQAQNGTLFLDEIGELPLNLQPKLLRALENRTIRRVGGESEIAVNVRIVAATHRNLKMLVEEGDFREDLFYRLNVVQLSIPPLRERKEDIPHLVQHFVRMGDVGGSKSFSTEALQALMHYNWPGNIRELRNVVLKSLVFADGVIGVEDIELGNQALVKITESYKPVDLEEVEKQKILEALALSEGERKKAAEMLGIARSTLFKKLKQYGIQ